jgi:alkylhydroperoxidase family enzyme
VPHALKAGVSQAAVEATRVQPLPADGPWSAAERLALEYTDAMTRDIQVPDALFERVRAQYEGQHLLDLTATVAAYNMVSRLLVALHVGH